MEDGMEVSTQLASQIGGAADKIRTVGLGNCQLIQLPVIHDPRGNLTFIEETRHIPFKIKRVYYLYDVPGGAVRAGHAHKTLCQFLVAMSGSFDVILDDGFKQQRFHLNRSYFGLYIPPMIWREIDNFSSGSVCMALASDYYDEADYYRDYEEYLQAVREEK
jgi:dTDP-4-dehydrorhamnose 3,5-epimerase-like enzyme